MDRSQELIKKKKKKKTCGLARRGLINSNDKAMLKNRSDGELDARGGINQGT